MLIKVNESYLELSKDTEISINSQAKLLEQLDNTPHDWSYAIELPNTTKNLAALGLPFPDASNESIYRNVVCTISKDDNTPLFTGRLRLESIDSKIITASFWAGNFEWLSALSGDLADLDWSEYDQDLTATTISDSWVEDAGLVYPLLDIGGLVTRSYRDLMVEDFTGCLHVKDIFYKIFNSAGIKLQGELLQDWIFPRAIIAKNNRSKNQIDARSAYARKTSNQDVTVTTIDKITFTDDSTYPFFDGNEDNYSTVNSRYTADVAMNVRLETNIAYEVLSSLWYFELRIYKNGVQYAYYVDTGAISRVIPLEAGDYLEIYFEAIRLGGAGTFRINSGSTVRYTPEFLYYTFGSDLVPNWTQRDFVLNYLNLFNVIPYFDATTKVLTLNFFEKIKSKQAIDISKYVEIDKIDYSYFISTFAKKNYLKYQESDDEDLKRYNVTQSVKYAAGVIEVSNDFIEDSKTLIESEFKTPVSYVNTAFNASLERIALITLENDGDSEITGVTDSGGVARFAIDREIFAAGDLVRITNSSLDTYLGDWRVSTTGSGYVELSGVPFDATATGTMSKLKYVPTNNDDVHIFIFIHEATSVLDISGFVQYYLEGSSKILIGYPYFNLLNTGRTINTKYTQGLCFGDVDDPLFYQQTLIDTYWRNIEGILNDPVVLEAMAWLPDAVFRQLTPLSPVFIKTKLTFGMYYLNKQVAWYGNTPLPCELELIKL